MKTDDESSSMSISGRFLRVPDHLETERSRILVTILTAGAYVSGAMFILTPLWRENPHPFLIAYGLTLLHNLIHIGLSIPPETVPTRRARRVDFAARDYARGSSP